MIRDTLTKTNLVLMIDDPVISANLAELFIKLQSGLTMGSWTGGVTKPGGSLMLTSNDDVLPRYRQRLLPIQWLHRKPEVLYKRKHAWQTKLLS